MAFFYLDPTDALRELRLLRSSQPDARLKLATLAEIYFPLVLGDPKALGGSLRLRPSRRQIVNANRALQVLLQCRGVSACMGAATAISGCLQAANRPVNSVACQLAYRGVRIWG